MSGYRHDDTVKVVVRVRPLLSRETSARIVHVDRGSQTVTIGAEDLEISSAGSISLGRGRGTAVHTFAFDHVYDERSSQEELYETMLRCRKSGICQNVKLDLRLGSAS